MRMLQGEDEPVHDGPLGPGPLVVMAPAGEDEAWYARYFTAGATGRAPVPWPEEEQLDAVVAREREDRRRDEGQRGAVTGILVLLGPHTVLPGALPGGALVARLVPSTADLPWDLDEVAPEPGVEPPCGRDGVPVLRLPRDAEHLLSLLLHCEFPPRGRLICLTGARGGLGASTLAGALARALATRGAETSLVDLDPAGGLGLTLGAEDRMGLRWADLPVDESAFHPIRLQGALPRWHRAALLTGDGRGGAPWGGGTRAVLRALAGASDVVVVDLPRGQEAPEGAEVLLVSGLDMRSAVGAEALVAGWESGTGRGSRSGTVWERAAEPAGRARRPGPVGLVARTLGEDVTVADLEAMSRATCLTELDTDRAAARRSARGEDPTDARGALRRAATALADHLWVAS